MPLTLDELAGLKQPTAARTPTLDELAGVKSPQGTKPVTLDDLAFGPSEQSDFEHRIQQALPIAEKFLEPTGVEFGVPGMAGTTAPTEEPKAFNGLPREFFPAFRGHGATGSWSEETLPEKIKNISIVDILAHLPFSPLHDYEKKGAAEAERKLRTGDYGPTRQYGMTPMGGFMTTRPPITAPQLQQIVETQKEKEARGETTPAAIAGGIADLPSFMGEMAAGGIGKVKSVPGALGFAGKMTAMQPGRVESALIDQVQRGEKGAMAIAKAWGDVYIENLSETAGAGLPAVVKKMPLGGKIIEGLQRFAKKTGMSDSQFWKTVGTKAGYNGLLGEWGEERLGTYLRGLTGVQDFGAGKDASADQRIAAGFAQDFQARNMLIEAGILLAPGAAKQVGKVVLGRRDKPFQPEAAPGIPPKAPVSAQKPTQVKPTTPVTPKIGQPPIAQELRTTPVVPPSVAPQIVPAPVVKPQAVAKPGEAVPSVAGQTGVVWPVIDLVEQAVGKPIEEMTKAEYEYGRWHDEKGRQLTSDGLNSYISYEEALEQKKAQSVAGQTAETGAVEQAGPGAETLKGLSKKEINTFKLGMRAAFQLKDGRIIETGYIHTMPDWMKTEDIAKVGFTRPDTKEFLTREQAGALTGIDEGADLEQFSEEISEAPPEELPDRELAEELLSAREDRRPREVTPIQPAPAQPLAPQLAPQGAERQPWEMPVREYAGQRPGPGAEATQWGRKTVEHKDQVQKALAEGKPVPRDVLEEYKSEKWAQDALAKETPAIPAREGEKAEVPKQGIVFVLKLQEDLASLKKQPLSQFDWKTAKVGDKTPSGETILARRVKTKAQAQQMADQQGARVFIDGPRTWAVIKPPVVTQGTGDPQTAAKTETAEIPELEQQKQEALKVARKNVREYLTDTEKKTPSPKLAPKGGEKKTEGPITTAEKDALRAKGYSVGEILKMTPAEARGKVKGEFKADPTEQGPAAGAPAFAGVAGRPGGKVEKPWLTMKRAESPNERMEAFFGETNRRPYTKKVSGIVQALRVGLQERFVFAHHIPRTKENAIFIDMIRTMPEERRAATEKAVRDIIAVLDNDGTVQALDSAGLDTLRRKVFVQDMLSEAKLNRSIPRDFSVEELEAEDKRLDEIMDKVPSVKKAYEARQKLWEDVSQDLLDRGVLDEESAKNKAYVRHFVLDMAEKNRPTGFLKKRLSDPFRAYSKHRKGSKRDISTDYLEVEVRALADIYADNAVEDVHNKIADLADKRKEYTRRAKAVNFEKLVGGTENVERIRELRNALAEKKTGPHRQEWIEELTKLDPTYPYRKRIAMHMSKFKNLTSEEDLDLDEDTTLFAELAKAAKEEAQEPRGMAARGVFKAMAERDQMVRQVLGKEYMTPEKLALTEGYREHTYKRPNIFYRAATLNEAQIAAFVENSAEEAGKMLNIPVDMIRQALVLGHQKNWILPEWLADQLDDLPVNKRSNYIVRSFTTPFIQFWKRWILRINPLRYNVRNTLGDTERFAVSGQETATKDIPAALKLLITKEGELYDLMKQHGVIASSLWHEMNDVSRMKEFERFKDYSKPKTFKAVTRAALGLPLRAISGVGSIEQNLTQLREDILRAAVFISNYNKLQAGKPVRHWAGKIADIEEIAKTDKARAAAKLSRETLGDYGAFTPFENDVLRQGVMPFYSWMKINTLFWPRVLFHAGAEGTLGKSLAAMAPRIGLNVAKWLIRALWIYGAAYWWNHRDEEAEKKEASLPFWLRATPHVNIGDRTLWGQTALSDFVEWADTEGLASVYWRMDAGFLSPKQAAMEASRIIAEAPVNKVYQAFNPFMKAPIMAVGGVETYPSVFNARVVASPASRESFERAVLQILGNDAKKFYLTVQGDRKLEDTLYAYFAGWFMKPMDPETLIAEIQKTKAAKWGPVLKSRSKQTGRGPGMAKKGREAEWQELKIRERALQGQSARRQPNDAPSAPNHLAGLPTLEELLAK